MSTRVDHHRSIMTWNRRGRSKTGHANDRKTLRNGKRYLPHRIKRDLEDEDEECQQTKENINI